MSEVKADQKVVLTLADLQEVLNYISTRPYAEVFKVVEVLKKSRTLESVLKEEALEVDADSQPIEEEIQVQQEA